jgi:hypothetical protein
MDRVLLLFQLFARLRKGTSLETNSIWSRRAPFVEGIRACKHSVLLLFVAPRASDSRLSPVSKDEGFHARFLLTENSSCFKSILPDAEVHRINYVISHESSAKKACSRR